VTDGRKTDREALIIFCFAKPSLKFIAWYLWGLGSKGDGKISIKKVFVWFFVKPVIAFLI